MPTFDKNRIFNSEPRKVLKREYENLKQDFSKLNAMRYKTFYENAPLSFILENSSLIFSEPYKGLEFYESVIKDSVLPLHRIEAEVVKVDTYFNEHVNQMSETQKEQYQNLCNTMHSKYDSMKNSICLYSNLMENVESMDSVYDDLYEYTREEDGCFPESIMTLLESSDINLLDMLHIGVTLPKIHPNLVQYLSECYYESPSEASDYAMNAYTTNVISRMMKDSYFSEKVSHIANMNLRHFIMGLGGVKDSDAVQEIMTERVKDYDPMFSTTENSVNRIFEDDVYSELLEDVNTEEKMNRLLCEKAILDMDLKFMQMDFLSEGTISSGVNSIVEQLCIESTTIEKIPQDIAGQMKILQEKADSVDAEIQAIQEKYFSSDGSPSRVVSYSVGRYGQDKMLKKDKKEEPPQETEWDTPKKKEASENPNKSSEDNTDDSSDDDKKDEKEADTAKDPEEDEDEKDEVKRQEKKKRRDDKYVNMDINDDEFYSTMKEASEDESEEQPVDKKAKKEKPVKVDKPEKRPFFQRVQNKALDTNVQFKKSVAKGQRTAQDARNAGKAIAKIPANVSDSIKKTVDTWEEQDDNRRKEYIIQPGYRKKYFKALQLAIMHGIAWSINPLLNIVLAISHKLSANKDERMKNELIRELKAEIKVTEEKIEDAKANGDNQQKYKLMRIKEKLDAEVVRVGANAKFI